MGEGGGMAAETHDERSYESFSHAGHDIPFPPSLSLFPISLSLALSLPLTFSVVLLQSVRRAHLHSSVVPSSAEKQFSVHMSPTSVIVRFFSLSQTISAVSHKKRNRKFMTASGSFGPLTFLLFLYYIRRTIKVIPTRIIIR